MRGEGEKRGEREREREGEREREREREKKWHLGNNWSTMLHVYHNFYYTMKLE